MSKNITELKVLVITHSSNSIYGAARSLKSLLNESKFKFDLVYMNNLRRKVPRELMKQWAGINCKNAYGYMFSVDMRPVMISDFKGKLKRLIRNILCIYGNYKIKKMIKNNKYDLVILNSMVLYKWIKVPAKTLIFVRCILLDNSVVYDDVLHEIEKAEKVVFIGPEYKVPFKDSDIKNSIILQNPFNMERVRDIEEFEVYKKYGLEGNLARNSIIVSILGVIQKEKGIDFAINALKYTKRKDIMFLIVGDGGKEYKEACMDISKNDKRIIWLGETNYPEEIYRITDYVLRADHVFGLGRTVYEGLFSGCGIIIQGDESCLKYFDNAEKYSEKIFFYDRNDIYSLVQVFENIGKIEKKDIGENNVAQYVNKFEQLLLN